MSEIIYISGKIGEEVISDATRQKFARAEEMLRAKGHEVFNPTCGKWQRHLQRLYESERKAEGARIDGTFPDFYAYALLHDLMALSTKDAIYMLSDWVKSPGAVVEYYFAKATGKRMYFQNYAESCDYLVHRMYREAEAVGKPIEYFDLAERNEIEKAYCEKHLDEVWLPLDLNSKEGEE